MVMYSLLLLSSAVMLTSASLYYAHAPQARVSVYHPKRGDPGAAAWTMPAKYPTPSPPTYPPTTTHPPPTYPPKTTTPPTYPPTTTHPPPTYPPKTTTPPTYPPTTTHPPPTYPPKTTTPPTYPPTTTHPPPTYPPKTTTPPTYPPTTTHPPPTYPPKTTTPPTYPPTTTHPPPTYPPKTPAPPAWQGHTTSKPTPAPGYGEPPFHSACACFENGNYYTPDIGDDCRTFWHRAAYGEARQQHCPAGLQFDTSTCVCNRPEYTECPTTCHKPTPKPNENSCTEKGNIYKQVPGTNCYKFSQETATLPPVIQSCPAGLQFDLNECVCNWPRNTVCYV